MNNFKKIIATIFAFSAILFYGTSLAADQTLGSVSVSPSSASIDVGSSTQLSASPLDQSGTAYSATTTSSWSSGDLSVASVDGTGMVTGVSAGTSTVSVSVTDGTSTVSGSALITVIDNSASSSSTSATSTNSTSTSTTSDASSTSTTSTSTTATSTTSTATSTTDTATSTTTTSTSTTSTATSTTDTATSTTSTSSTTASTTVRTASFTIRDGSSVIWSGQVSVPDSDTATTTITATDGATSTVDAASVLAALVSADAAQPEFSISDLQYYSSYGSFYLNCITEASSSQQLCGNWQYVVDGTYPSVGMDSYVLHDGDSVYLYFGSQRRFSLSSSETVPEIPVVAHVESYNYTNNSWSPLSGEVVGATTPDPSNPWSPIVVATSTSDANGDATLSVSAIGSYGVGLADDYYSTTTPLTVRALASDEVAFHVRNGNDIAYQGIEQISNATATIAASDGSTHGVSGLTPLAVLMSAANASGTAFSVSDLEYYDSYGSFYVKCITVSSSSLCDNWQYAVNGGVPGVGADSYSLSGGDDVYFFYGSPRRVSVSSSTVTVGSQFTATAGKYNPSDDTYSPVAGLTIGVTQPDPSNPWSPLEIATSTSGADGTAVFTINATGTYQLGIKEDYYSPATDLVVSEAPAAAPASAPSPVVGVGGGGGAVSYHHSVDVAKATQFLVSNENSDGSFGPLLYTDWAAIALSAGAPGSTGAVAAYLKSANSGMSLATDYERHAMALMSLGINPYSGTPVDYIKKITDAFDGAQIGDPGLVNDDIFSLFPLVKAGYSFSDPMLQKIIAFILSKQGSDGSWDGTVDMTAAAVQALSPATSVNGVSDALSRARAYLAGHQNANGGFGSSYSTSWAVQAVTALHEQASNWEINGNNPFDYLSSLQASDGGIESASTDLASRVWATSYAIPASLNKTWYDMLSSFAKPAADDAYASGGGGAAAPQEEATTTEETAASSTTTSTTIAITEITTSTASSSLETATSTASSSAQMAVLAAAKTPARNIAAIPKAAPPASQKRVAASPAAEKAASTTVGKPAQSAAVAENAGVSEPVQRRGLASIASAIGSDILNFASNIGGLIVSKIFSIIKLIP